MVDISLPSDRSGSVSNSKDDGAAHARTETQGLMMSPTRVAFLDSKVWGNVSFETADAGKPEQKAGNTDKPQPKAEDAPKAGQDGKPAVVGKDGKPVESCPGDEDYKTLIDATARLIYDPTKLGDIKKLMNPPACIATTDEAVKLADEAIKVVDDPYTDILPAKEAEELKTQMEGHLSGIGVQIGRPESAPGKAPATDGPVNVEIVFPNSPASAAGIHKGDLITSVNGQDVSKLSVDDIAAKLLRGAEGTEAKVSVLRDGKPKEFDIKRADYSFPSVEDKKIGDFAYIHLEDLGQDDSAEELKNALSRHQNAKGFILDLRDNPGGQVPQALLAASLIMDHGEIMHVKSRIDSDPANPEYATEKYVVTKSGIKVTDEKGVQIGDGEEPRMPDLVKKPLVILTNEGTASAAEILAGALKDNREGVLLGEKTFGKGIGQQAIPDMPGGSTLKVTNFRFFSPSNQWIGDGHNNRTGITPDVTVVNPKGVEYGSAQDAQLNAAVKLLEEKIAPKKK